MRIACIGAGPAGLYFAILRKMAAPDDEIVVVERNRADDPYGWGIVFSDATLSNLRQADAETHDDILRKFHHWDAIDIHFKGTRITTGGHGFAGISRAGLLSILQRRASALGVRLSFATAVGDVDAYARDFDLVVAADGVNSATRNRHADVFQPDLQPSVCRFLWLGARHTLDAFTFDFKETEAGWFNLHAYRFDADWSTFIVETPEVKWRSAGLDRMTRDQSLNFCECLFAAHLGGKKLIANTNLPDTALWQQFQRVLCRRWHHRNIVLIGDAAHTAHFSIGSGTRMAMEDAIALADALAAEGDVARALPAYQSAREPAALRLQSAARNRMEWFENTSRHACLDPLQFAYSLLTGSQRVGHDSLRQRDSIYVDRFESWLAEQSGLAALPIPPMFTPFRCRGLRLANRVAVSPMAMYACNDGIAGDFHQSHLGAFALGGAGLIFTEMTAVSADARITPRCAGIWNDEQAAAWRRIVDFVHSRSSAKIALQLGHAGAKGSTRPPWEGADKPLATDNDHDRNWPLIAASALPWAGQSQKPRQMARADMQRVCGDFVAATVRAVAAGFDLLELHCAHGYLLSGFISPLRNRRDDEYGGSLENRCRFPLEVFAAVRVAWPVDKPIFVRISAVDWAPGGNTAEDAVAIARLFKAAGADLIDVSSGQTSLAASPVYGRMYQTPLADRIRNEAGIATIAVGNITEPDQVNTIIAAGRADLCAIGRPHLVDPHWTHRAAVELGFADPSMPKRYAAGYGQLGNQLKRHAENKYRPK
jgi:anthraniloyl-CoA monooxygenase